jgi:SNF2 family DNA or RNA helicase
MILSFDKDKTSVLFMHEDGKEYRFLHDFPALLKGALYYYAPLKPGVVHNILGRIRLHYKGKIKINEDVHTWMNTPKKLFEIPEKFKYHTQPHKAQEVALRFMYTFGSGGLLLDPGMGKSKVVLDYIWLKQFKKTAVICPLPLCFVWEDEIEKHRPELSYYVAKTTDWEKEQPNMDVDVLIINYNKAVLFEKQLKKLGFDFVYLDEALIKDPVSLRTQALTSIAKDVPYKSLGSGTLINNSIMDAFCPSRFIEPALVGYSYKNFLDHHAVRYSNKAANAIPRIVGFKYANEAKSILQTCCIVMTKEEWLKELPGKEFEDIYVQPSDYQRKLYKDLASNYIVQVGEEWVEVDNPLVMMSKLYQISQGFIHNNYEETDTEDLLGVAKLPKAKKKKARSTIRFEDQPKLDALEKIITTKIQERRAIVWFNLTEEYELIKERLEQMGIKFLVIRGGEKDTGGKVRLFNKDNSYQFLLAQAKSVNYGITVLGHSKGTDTEDENDDLAGVYAPALDSEVFTEIFYSVSFSSEVYSQQQDRIHRFGQKNTCKYYRIFCNTPIEHKIRVALEDKLILRKEMLVDIAQSLKDEVEVEGVE